MGKRGRNAQRRERLIERWQLSGESATRFARRSRVSVATLWYWKRRFEQETEVPGLVPVRLIDEATVQEVRPLELVYVDGRRLLIPSDMPTEVLLSILRALSC